MINQELHVNWCDEFGGLSVDCKLDSFYGRFDHLIERPLPCDYLSWFSYDLISSLRDKNRAHWLYKFSLKLENFIEFKRLRAICIRKRKECYAIYLKKIQSSSKFIMKSFWFFVNYKRKFDKIVNSVSLGEFEACEGDDVANLFASHFKSFYFKSSPSLPLPLAVPISLQNIQITRSELIEAII